MTEKELKLTKFSYDVQLLFPVILLVGIGITMVYSASSAIALEKMQNDYYFVQRQAVFGMLGIFVLIICRHIPYKVFRSFSYIILLTAFIMLLTILISSLGVTAGGAKRWLSLGAISFQPSELARFAMIIYLAYSLSKKKDMIKQFSIGFMPHVIVLGIFIFLILMQPDFGSAVILTMIAWIMMFVAGVRIKHLTLPLIPILPATYFFMISASYRRDRWFYFLNPWDHETTGGYQIVHSLLAFGTGGIFGKGFGQGYQKLFYLPEPHTDFIFSVIGEELGLIGVLIILTLYIMIIWKGISIALNTDDKFGSYAALGLTTALGLQVCVNMGVALSLLPTKGLTLPFLSYGGSSLILNMASIGILMNIGAKSKSK